MSSAVEEYAAKHEKLEEARSKWKSFIGALRTATDTLAASQRPKEVGIKNWPSFDDLEAHRDELEKHELAAAEAYAAIPQSQRALVKPPEPMNMKSQRSNLSGDLDFDELFDGLFGRKSR